MISSTILFPNTAPDLVRYGAAILGQYLRPHESGSSSRRSRIRHGDESLSAGSRGISSTRGSAADLWLSSTVSVYVGWIRLSSTLDSLIESTFETTLLGRREFAIRHPASQTRLGVPDRVVGNPARERQPPRPPLHLGCVTPSAVATSSAVISLSLGSGRVAASACETKSLAVHGMKHQMRFPRSLRLQRSDRNTTAFTPNGVNAVVWPFSAHTRRAS